MNVYFLELICIGIMWIGLRYAIFGKQDAFFSRLFTALAAVLIGVYAGVGIKACLMWWNEDPTLHFPATLVEKLQFMMMFVAVACVIFVGWKLIRRLFNQDELNA